MFKAKSFSSPDIMVLDIEICISFFSANLRFSKPLKILEIGGGKLSQKVLKNLMKNLVGQKINKFLYSEMLQISKNHMISRPWNLGITWKILKNHP